MPTTVISDGKILYHALEELNITEKWVQDELNKNNITSVQDVIYAEINTDGTLYIQKK